MKRSHALVVACGVIAGVVTAAHADQVYVQLEGTQAGRGVAVTLSNGLTFWDGSTSKSVWAGQRNTTINGEQVRTYSAELMSRNGSGWYDQTSASDSLGAVKASAISSLYSHTGNGSFASRDEAAAYQALLWEIVYDYDGSDGSINLADGNIRIGMINNNTFAALKGQALSDGPAKMVTVVGSGTYGDHFRVVPLPSAAGLAALGLLGLAGARRRA